MIKHDQECSKILILRKIGLIMKMVLAKLQSKADQEKNWITGKVFDVSPYVLDIISSGYKIPFVEEPPCAKFENNKSALNNSEFVNEALAGLVETGCVCWKSPSFLKLLILFQFQQKIIRG